MGYLCEIPESCVVAGHQLSIGVTNSMHAIAIRRVSKPTYYVRGCKINEKEMAGSTGAQKVLNCCPATENPVLMRALRGNVVAAFSLLTYNS